MSTDAYQRNREFYGNTGGSYRVQTTDTGIIALVPPLAKHTTFVQRIHVQVNTLTASELWGFQDGAGLPIASAVSAATVGHVDYDFGPDGVPCTEATAFNLNISGATGAAGFVSWESYKKCTNPAL